MPQIVCLTNRLAVTLIAMASSALLAPALPATPAAAATPNFPPFATGALSIGRHAVPAQSAKFIQTAAKRPPSRGPQQGSEPANAHAQAANGGNADQWNAGLVLTPQQRQRAVAFARLDYGLYFIGSALAIGVYLGMWLTGAGERAAYLARRASRYLFLQSLVAFVLVYGIAQMVRLPFAFYAGFVVDRRFGLSRETAAMWFADWAKYAALIVVAGAIIFYVFGCIVRRNSAGWWWRFWLAQIPLVVAVIFVAPLVVDPLFYRFTPLANTQPELTQQIERMTRRAGLNIPASHIFSMNASSKTTELNAYVSGLGASKRVVVWDTTLAALTPEQTLLVLGHETGHYALHHIPKEFAIDELIVLGLFYACYLALKGLLRSRPGAIQNLAALPALLTMVAALAFLSSPLFCAVSRYYEHQADQYGLEVAHGIVADPNAAEIAADQKLGVRDLSDPDPPGWIVFWLYTHPPIAERIRFAANYRPWAQGKHGEFVSE